MSRTLLVDENGGDENGDTLSRRRASGPHRGSEVLLKMGSGSPKGNEEGQCG